MSRHQKSVRKERSAGRQTNNMQETSTLWTKIASLFLPKNGRKLRTNRYMFHTSIFVVVLFLGLVGYLVKFTIYDAPEVINSPYNNRTSALSEKILRGRLIIYEAEQSVCRAAFSLDTGEVDDKGERILKKYNGQFFISQQLEVAYCIFVKNRLKLRGSTPPPGLNPPSAAGSPPEGQRMRPSAANLEKRGNL